MIDRPDPVSRVAPPSTIITMIMAATREQPDRDGAAAFARRGTIHAGGTGKFVHVEGHGTVYGADAS